MGRIGTATPQERESVLAMFCRHFNAHPSIPDHNGTFRTPKIIHSESASELYFWCKARGYFRLWSYMFVNWYRPGQWELWARSANPAEILVLKTTMIVESHWRKIKHDFFHRFNRPRIDLVLWVLISRVMPSALNRLKAIMARDYRKATPSWQKDFKKQWKELSHRGPESESFRRYYADPQKWVCGCEFFLLSRFLICKHLIHCFEPVAWPSEFFRDIRRQRSSPYWVYKNSQLVLHPEFASFVEQLPTDMSEVESEVESDIDERALGEDDLVTLDDPEDSKPEVDLDQFFSTNQHMLDLVKEQHAKGNIEFIRRVIKANASNQV